MTTRRAFLSMLCAAPVAVPAAVKAAVSTPPNAAFAKYLTNLDPHVHGVSVSGVAWPLRPHTETATLKIAVDTSELKRATQEISTMSDFADDVARYLPRTKELTPEQQASSLLFADSRFVPMHRDDRNLIEPGTGGKRVSFNEIVERYRMAMGPPSLQSHRLVYLGSPYTKYAAGLDAAFRDVAAIAAQMLQDGVRVYSPITHTHPIAIHGNLDPRNHDIWLPFDQAMMDAADAMCIADMDGWRESYGVQYEIDYFRRQGKPVYFRTVSGDVSEYAK